MPNLWTMLCVVSVITSNAQASLPSLNQKRSEIDWNDGFTITTTTVPAAAFAVADLTPATSDAWTEHNAATSSVDESSHTTTTTNTAADEAAGDEENRPLVDTHNRPARFKDYTLSPAVINGTTAEYLYDHTESSPAQALAFVHHNKADRDRDRDAGDVIGDDGNDGDDNHHHDDDRTKTFTDELIETVHHIVDEFQQNNSTPTAIGDDVNRPHMAGIDATVIKRQHNQLSFGHSMFTAKNLSGPPNMLNDESERLPLPATGAVTPLPWTTLLPTIITATIKLSPPQFDEAHEALATSVTLTNEQSTRLSRLSPIENDATTTPLPQRMANAAPSASQMPLPKVFDEQLTIVKNVEGAQAQVRPQTATEELFNTLQRHLETANALEKLERALEEEIRNPGQAPVIESAIREVVDPETQHEFTKDIVVVQRPTPEDAAEKIQANLEQTIQQIFEETRSVAAEIDKLHPYDVLLDDRKIEVNISDGATVHGAVTTTTTQSTDDGAHIIQETTMTNGGVEQQTEFYRSDELREATTMTPTTAGDRPSPELTVEGRSSKSIIDNSIATNELFPAMNEPQLGNDEFLYGRETVFTITTTIAPVGETADHTKNAINSGRQPWPTTVAAAAAGFRTETNRPNIESPITEQILIVGRPETSKDYVRHTVTPSPSPFPFPLNAGDELTTAVYAYIPETSTAAESTIADNEETTNAHNNHKNNTNDNIPIKQKRIVEIPHADISTDPSANTTTTTTTPTLLYDESMPHSIGDGVEPVTATTTETISIITQISSSAVAATAAPNATELNRPHRVQPTNTPPASELPFTLQRHHNSNATASNNLTSTGTTTVVPNYDITDADSTSTSAPASSEGDTDSFDTEEQRPHRRMSSSDSSSSEESDENISQNSNSNSNSAYAGPFIFPHDTNDGREIFDVNSSSSSSSNSGKRGTKENLDALISAARQRSAIALEIGILEKENEEGIYDSYSEYSTTELTATSTTFTTTVAPTFPELETIVENTLGDGGTINDHTVIKKDGVTGGGGGGSGSGSGSGGGNINATANNVHRHTEITIAIDDIHTDPVMANDKTPIDMPMRVSDLSINSRLEQAIADNRVHSDAVSDNLDLTKPKLNELNALTVAKTPVMLIVCLMTIIGIMFVALVMLAITKSQQYGGLNLVPV